MTEETAVRESNLISVNCNLCGRDDYMVVHPATLKAEAGLAQTEPDAFRCTSPGYHRHLRIVRCNNCGFVYCNPQFDPDDLLQSYEDVEDEMYVNERLGRKLTFSRHLRVLEGIVGTAARRRLLDVGAYVGVFVEVAQEAGWQATGVEPSRWAVAYAREQGLPVMQGNLQSADLMPASFDVVTMWDVIEHFHDPMMELRDAYRLLQPGGWIAIHTIDYGSMTARLMGKRWPFFMDMHVVYFTRATLRAMLEKAGFEFHKVHTQGRYLRAGYLANRLGAAFSPRLGDVVQGWLKRTGLAAVPIPVNTFDLFTMYARKPE